MLVTMWMLGVVKMTKWKLVTMRMLVKTLGVI